MVGEERNNLWNIDFDNYRFVALLFGYFEVLQKPGVNRFVAQYNAWQARNDHAGLATKDRGTGETCDVIAL